MYATRYPRNHLSSRFRPSVRKTLRNRTPQPQDALRMYETLLRARKKTKPAPANVCHRIFLNRARVSNPPDCADPGLHPDRRHKTTQYGPNGYAGELGAAPPPEQLRTPATNAPPAFPGEAAFRRVPAPLECAGHRALFDRGTIGSKKGVLPVPGPPNGFYFRFPTRKNGGPNRTRRGTKPQDGRQYAVPPSPTGRRSKSPAF